MIYTPWAQLIHLENRRFLLLRHQGKWQHPDLPDGSHGRVLPPGRPVDQQEPVTTLGRTPARTGRSRRTPVAFETCRRRRARTHTSPGTRSAREPSRIPRALRPVLLASASRTRGLFATGGETHLRRSWPKSARALMASTRLIGSIPRATTSRAMCGGPPETSRPKTTVPSNGPHGP